MSDYQKAKIYKITNDYNNDIYVGSTCDTLVKRFSYHKSDAKKENRKTRPLYSLMNNIGFERFRIELICDYPCADKYQLIQKEGEYIRNLGTLNKIISGRTHKEYINDNKDKVRQYEKEYRETNSEIIKIKQKEYFEAMKNSEKYKEYKKEYYEQNKEKLKAYSRETNSKPIICGCGCTIKYGGRLKHEKTKKHLDLMDAKKSQQNTEEN